VIRFWPNWTANRSETDREWTRMHTKERRSADERGFTQIGVATR
jgi:hypothetical protein